VWLLDNALASNIHALFTAELYMGLVHPWVGLGWVNKFGPITEIYIPPLRPTGKIEQEWSTN